MRNNTLSVKSVLLYASLLIVCVMLLFSMVSGYSGFMKGYTTALNAEPKQIAVTQKNLYSPKLDDLIPRTVRFTYEHPTAQEICLYADFNLWGTHELKLERVSPGKFAKTVVLPQGEYKYYFTVDGEHALDPAVGSRAQFDGREVCLKTVL